MNVNRKKSESASETQSCRMASSTYPPMILNLQLVPSSKHTATATLNTLAKLAIMALISMPPRLRASM